MMPVCVDFDHRLLGRQQRCPEPDVLEQVLEGFLWFQLESPWFGCLMNGAVDGCLRGVPSLRAGPRGMVLGTYRCSSDERK